MTLRLTLTLALATVLAGCAAPRAVTTPAGPGPADATAVPPVVQDANPTDGRCAHCGLVERIERTAAAPAARKEGQDSGGIVGNVLNDDAAAATPAASGFEITVRLDNGSVVTVRQRALGGVRQGQRVEIVEGRAQPLLQ